MQSEIEFIIDTIADEAIVYDEQNSFCRPNIDNLVGHLKEDIRDKVKDDISANFKWLYNAFHFNDSTAAWDYFKQFLIDGFLAFEIIYGEDGKKIIGSKVLDPTSLRPGMEEGGSGFKKVWYQYEEDDKMAGKLYDSQIIYISYSTGNMVTRASYAERLVRSFNLLRIMENTRLIWNLMNSTFRLKMTVPIGSKSPQRAKESLNELLAIYKEDVYLDFDSGELLINGKPSMQFYKNYLLPEKNGEKPDVETVSSDGPDLNSIESLEYFWDKLKMDSKIPFSRFDKSGGGGQWSEGADSLDREEIRFNKFVTRLRSVFQEIIWKPLWLQMCLDYPDLAEDEIFRANLGITFNKDNLFEEMKHLEIFQKRLDFASSMRDYTKDDGDTPYFSARYVAERYLKLTPEELAENAAYLKADLGDEDDADDAADSGSWD